MSGRPHCPKCKLVQRNRLGTECERCGGPVFWTRPPPPVVRVDEKGKVLSVEECPEEGRVMTDEKKTTRITISGPTGSGKTTWAQILVGFLREHGLTVDLGDMPELDRDLLCGLDHIPVRTREQLERQPELFFPVILSIEAAGEMTDEEKFDLLAWILKKWEIPEDATKGQVQGLMHVAYHEAHGYRTYIVAYRCDDKQGKIARLSVRVKELEEGVSAEVSAIPEHVIVREDGADEDVLASLAVSVGKLKTERNELDASNKDLNDRRLEQLGRADRLERELKESDGRVGSMQRDYEAEHERVKELEVNYRQAVDQIAALEEVIADADREE